MKPIDMSNKIFSRLTVLQRTENNKKGLAMWQCLCDCGKTIDVPGSQLKNGQTTSCGCLKREKLKASATKHGKYRTGAYVSWNNMIQRCCNPNNHKFHLYGGRDIQVCERWQKFEHFYEDMGERPPKHSIDRIDNDGNYSPSNCRWAINKAQCRNKKNSLIFNGKHLKQIAEDRGISYYTLRAAMRRGENPQTYTPKNH